MVCLYLKNKGSAVRFCLWPQGFFFLKTKYRPKRRPNLYNLVMEAIKIIVAVAGFFLILMSLINSMDTTEGGLSWVFFVVTIGFVFYVFGFFDEFKKK